MAYFEGENFILKVVGFTQTETGHDHTTTPCSSSGASTLPMKKDNASPTKRQKSSGSLSLIFF